MFYYLSYMCIIMIYNRIHVSKFEDCTVGVG